MPTLGPNVAGSWYAAERQALARQVEGLLADPADALAQEVSPADAVLAPHAGLVYSGRVAARVFLALRREGVRRVLLLGPSHYVAFTGGAVPAAERYRTPLGDLPLDTETLRELSGQPGMRADDAPFAREHSLEAELPFLQCLLPPACRLLPVLLGAGSRAGDLDSVAEALRPLLDAETVVVVSSDFTHYGVRFGFVPFERELPRRIEELDLGAARRIRSLDQKGFDAYVAETGATICGRAAISVLLRLLPASTRAELSAYDTSGRMTGDWSHTVSYAGMAFAWRDGP